MKEEMKMNIELIKQFIALRQELNAAGVIGVSLHNDEVHVRSEVLIGEDSLEVEYNAESTYPYRITTVKDGVNLFAIVTGEELEESFPQLKGYLVEDVDLSGMKEVI
jgi:hypothetical protein